MSVSIVSEYSLPESNASGPVCQNQVNQNLVCQGSTFQSPMCQSTVCQSSMCLAPSVLLNKVRELRDTQEEPERYLRGRPERDLKGT